MDKKNVYQMIQEVTKRISKVGIAKKRVNEQQKFKFRGIDDVTNTLSPILAEVGLVVTPNFVERTCVERATKTGGTLFYTVVQGEYRLISTEDGSSCTVVLYGEAMDSADKSTNKAMSNAYKYMAIQTFCIPTVGEPDSDSQSFEVKNRIEEQKDKYAPLIESATTLDELKQIWSDVPAEVKPLLNSKKETKKNLLTEPTADIV